jgi:hypothetical protein
MAIVLLFREGKPERSRYLYAVGTCMQSYVFNITLKYLPKKPNILLQHFAKLATLSGC